MENDDLLKNLELKLNNYFMSKQKIYDENKGITENRIKLIKEIGNDKNIDDILKAEQIITEYELRVYGCNKYSVLQTFNKTFKELDKAFKALSVVRNNEIYKIFNDAYPLGNRIKGLPKDAFHAFINAHTKRLGKRQLVLGMSAEHYLLLQERCNNLIIARKEYMLLQAKALDIDLFEKK